MDKKEWKPLVSIIIPVYNGSNYMREAIDSALAQTYKNIEILVINDGSIDDGETERIALSYGDKIRYFSKENGGVATALNLGIEQMKGEYFSWLSHDDMYAPNKVEKQIIILSKIEDKTTILACGFKVIDGKGKHIYTVDPLGAGQFSQQQLNTPLFALFSNAIHGCALLIHKSHFDRKGLFDISLRTTQDYDLWFKIMRGQNFIYHEGLLVLARVHEAQDSKHKLALSQTESDALWIHMMDTLTPIEMIQLHGSEDRFYYTILKRLLDEPFPYIRAIEYAKKKLEGKYCGVAFDAVNRELSYARAMAGLLYETNRRRGIMRSIVDTVYFIVMRLGLMKIAKTIVRCLCLERAAKRMMVGQIL